MKNHKWFGKAVHNKQFSASELAFFITTLHIYAVLNVIAEMICNQLAYSTPGCFSPVTQKHYFCE